ncbi:MAG: hypothetical protein AAGF23_19950 [Acidobacteriota bacterium]
MAGDHERRVRELERAGARGREVEELLAYTANPFDLSRLEAGLRLPLRDEAFVAGWRRWEEDARRDGAYRVLRRHLPELAFPIRDGVSHWPSYRQATLHGEDPADLPGASGLVVASPASVELEVRPSPAGAVPVITVGDRRTFVALARALTRRNEPEPIPEALGGLMITGYTNWSRLRANGGGWDLEEASRSSGDRFMLLSDGPYSAVPAARLGLGADRWRRRSLELRRAHEEVHYLMRRLLGAMRNNLFDELIAEYAGMHLAWGVFRADWLRLFLGLERRRGVRADARLDVYRGDPPLSDGAFEALGVLVRRAIDTLESFDAAVADVSAGPQRLAAVVGALASQPLELLAAPSGGERVLTAFRDLDRRLAPATGAAASAARSAR